jgi:hypothetical protein
MRLTATSRAASNLGAEIGGNRYGQDVGTDELGKRSAERTLHCPP